MYSKSFILSNDLVSNCSLTQVFLRVYFSRRRSARIKKLTDQKLIGTPQDLEVDTFSDHGDHFGAP